MRELSVAAKLIRPAVFAELQGRIDRLSARGEELLPLHIGDTFLPPPAAARRAMSTLEADDTSLYRYGATGGLPALRKALARVVPCEDETEILVGNGGTHALFCAARVVLDEDDEVLMASPYWPLAPGVFGACGAACIEVPIAQRVSDDPSFDVRAAFERHVGPLTKAIYFVSPNNPDGHVLRREHLEAIAALAIERDLWVFADEVYAQMIYAEAPGSIRDLPGMRERTLVLRSLSKSHSLAGARIGFVVGPARVITAAKRVSTHSAFNVAVAMQRVALAALEDETYVAEACATYRSARDAAVRALEGAPVRFHVPGGAAYLFIDFAPAFEARPHASRPLYGVLEEAVDRGVLLAPGEAFGASYGSFARLCFTSVPAARVIEGIARLREAIEVWQRT
jgi:aspartate/methionine/tyrosine aminotransferase